MIDIGINRDLFFPLYKKRRALTYMKHNIEEAFKKCGIVPFNPCAFLAQGSKAPSAPTSKGEFLLEMTPYTKCALRQQMNLALEFIKMATRGELCKLILRFSHTAEYMAVQADSTHAKAKKLCEVVKQIHPSNKDLQQLGKGNLAGVMIGEDILNNMEEQE